jgi:hypothetical protein
MRHAPARDQAPQRRRAVISVQTAKTKIDGLGVVSWARTHLADTAEERLNRR